MTVFSAQLQCTLQDTLYYFSPMMYTVLMLSSPKLTVVAMAQASPGTNRKSELCVHLQCEAPHA